MLKKGANVFESNLDSLALPEATNAQAKCPQTVRVEGKERSLSHGCTEQHGEVRDRRRGNDGQRAPYQSVPSSHRRRGRCCYS
jgi:hypothetical protein